VQRSAERELSSSSLLRSNALRILRAVLGAAVAVAGVLIVLGELDYQLERCNSEAVVMQVRFWPPFAAEAIIAAGLVLAGWPRSKPNAGRVAPQRRWLGQTTVSVVSLFLGAVLVLLAQQRAVGPCILAETTQLSIWATGHIAGPVILAIGVLAAVWPRDRRSQHREDEFDAALIDGS